MSACLPRVPRWGPAGALPVFRSRRGGEYPCLQNFRRGVSGRPSSPYPGLGRVTASDTIFPAYVNSLARRFSLSTGVWWSDLCYRHARKARPSSLRLCGKKLSSLTKPHFREDVRPETQRLSNAPPGLPRPPVTHT